MNLCERRKKLHTYEEIKMLNVDGRTTSLGKRSQIVTLPSLTGARQMHLKEIFAINNVPISTCSCLVLLSATVASSIMPRTVPFTRAVSFTHSTCSVSFTGTRPRISSHLTGALHPGRFVVWGWVDSHLFCQIEVLCGSCRSNANARHVAPTLRCGSHQQNATLRPCVRT